MSMTNTAYYEANKRNRELNRVEIAIQDRLSVGERIAWNELKRMVASNTEAAIFSEAVDNLTEVGILEIIRPYVKSGRRPKVILYKGYASDQEGYSQETWDKHILNEAQAIKDDQPSQPYSAYLEDLAASK